MTTISRVTRKARKEHKCNWCGGVIKKGEKYDYSVHEYDGIYIWKNHKYCMELVSILDMDDDHEGITEEDFYEYVDESFIDNFPNDTNKYKTSEKALLLYIKIGQ